MSVRVAEAAVLSLAVALGSHRLEECDEIGGGRWGNLDGRREVVKAVRSQGAGRAISEDFEDPSLLCTWLDSRGVEVDSSPESLRSGPQEAEIP